MKANAAVEWELEIGGLRISLDQPLEIGRDPACELPIEDERASWRHLRLSADNGEVVLVDLKSKNGTYLNGRRIDSDPIRISSEALIQLGSTRARLRPVAAPVGETDGGFRRIPIRGRLLRIGRAPDNDVRLE